MEELQVFTNIPYAALPVAGDQQAGSSFLSDIRELQIGQGGTNVFRADRDGIFMGAKSFAAAPFSVNMLGNIVATSIKIVAAAGSEVDWSYLQNIAVTNAHISGTILVGHTQAKCTNALADQTSVNTAADTAKVQGYTIISGGYIATSYLSADNIQTGTLTGRIVRTSSGTTRVEMNVANNELRIYQNGYERVVLGSGVLWFGTTSGVGAGAIYGFGTNQLAINTGSYTYFFNESAFFPSHNVLTIGTASYRFNNVYSVSGNFSGTINVSGAVISNTSVLAPAFSAYGGGKATFHGSVTACPLPISTSLALEKIGNPKPTPYGKLKDKRFVERNKDRKDMGIERMYYDVKQVPKECRFLNSEGKDDIEISRTVGFLYQCVVELNNKIEILKQEVDAK